jgi:hypothetical protein
LSAIDANLFTRVDVLIRIWFQNISTKKMADLDTRHPHDVVAESMLNGGPGQYGPDGEELGQVTRYLEMHVELLIIIIPLLITYLVVMKL